MPKLKQRDVTRLNKKWKCTLPKEYVDFMKKHDPDEDVLEPDCFMLKIDGREAVVEGIMIGPLPTEGEDDIPGVEQPVETEIDEEWGGLHGSKRPKWLPEGAIPIGGTMWNARPLLIIEGPHAGEVWFSSSIKGKNRCFPGAKDFRAFIKALVEAPPASVPRVGQAV
jgi:hypothetical protein